MGDGSLSQFCLKKMESFEVAVQDPTPLFESESLCGIFDVCRSVYALKMMPHHAYVHACAHPITHACLRYSWDTVSSATFTLAM